MSKLLIIFAFELLEVHLASLDIVICIHIIITLRKLERRA